MRNRMLVSMLCALMALPSLAQTTPIPLNDHERLGQCFTATRPVMIVAVCVPSWSDNEGGLTITVWDSPERKTKLAERVATDIRDNEFVEVRPAKPLDPGTYYWEVSARTGTTRIGLYSLALPDATTDCAYIDGQPQPNSRFNHRVDVGPPARETVPILITRLERGSPEEKESACRELAVYGTAEAVPALSKLLADPQFSHLARYAMESLPAKEVDAALEAALDSLKGDLLIGVINSLGVRRDAGAVGKLMALLKADDEAVAGAAAVALGQISGQGAATALGAVLDGALVKPRAFYEGALACADRLLADGKPEAAAALYERLTSDPAPEAVQLGALRGEILARGDDGLALMLKLLHDDAPARREVALWLAQHALPGEPVTAALVAEVNRLPEEQQPLVLGAIARRGDATALRAVQTLAADARKPIRLAATSLLPGFGGAAVPALTNLLTDPDADVAQAAQNALVDLPRDDGSRLAAKLLLDADAARHRIGIWLIRKLQRSSFVPALCIDLRNPAAEVRHEAASALSELGGADAVGPLRDALLSTTDADEAALLERALTTAAVRAGDPEAVAAQLTYAWADRPPTQRMPLLRILGAVGGERALKVVVETIKTADGEVRATALDSLCDWPSAMAAGELLTLAREAPAEERLTCLRAALSQVGIDGTPAELRLQICRDATLLIQRDDERKLLLSAIGGVPSFDALAMVVPYLNSAVKEEACAAALQIAEKLAKDPNAARLAEPLAQVAAVATNPDFVKRAKELLAKVKPAG